FTARIADYGKRVYNASQRGGDSVAVRGLSAVADRRSDLNRISKFLLAPRGRCEGHLPRVLGELAPRRNSRRRFDHHAAIDQDQLPDAGAHLSRKIRRGREGEWPRTTV